MTFAINKPFVVTGLVILLLWIAGLALCAISGNLAPLQSGQITELGVCLTADQYTPTTVIPRDAQDLFVCGFVSGNSKTSAAFYIFRKGDVIAQATGTVGPGPFFLSPLQWSPITSGTYLLQASSQRVVLIDSTFEVK